MNGERARGMNGERARGMSAPAEQLPDTAPPSWRQAVLPRPGRAYAGIVAAAAALAGGAAASAAASLPSAVASAALGAFAAVAACGDAVTGRIPNKLTGGGLVLAAGSLGALALLNGEAGSAGRAALGAAAAFGFFFLLWVIAPAGMGMGDVKLAPTLGAFTAFAGWPVWVRASVGAFALQALIVVALMVSGRAGRRSAVPFGPAMCGAAVLALVTA